MSFTPIIVTATFSDPDDVASTLGQVVFQLSSAMTDVATGEVVEPAPATAQIIEGAIQLTVLANTDPTTTPPTCTYVVTERLVGAIERSYTVVVPYDAAGGTITLAELTAAP